MALNPAPRIRAFLLRKSLAVFLLLFACSWPNPSTLAQEASFEQELAAILKEPAYVDRLVNPRRQELLRDLIARHVGHPELKQAQLQLCYALRQETTEMGNAEAAGLLGNLIAEEDESTDFYLRLAESYENLQLTWLRGRNIQNLPEARRIAQRLIAIGQAKDLPAVEMQGYEYLAAANTQMGNYTEAVNDLFAAMERSELWLRNGRYAQERQKSRGAGMEMEVAIHNTANSLTGLTRYAADDLLSQRKIVRLIQQRFGQSVRYAKFETWTSSLQRVREEWEQKRAELRRRGKLAPALRPEANLAWL